MIDFHCSKNYISELSCSKNRKKEWGEKVPVPSTLYFIETCAFNISEILGSTEEYFYALLSVFDSEGNRHFLDLYFTNLYPCYSA